MAEEKEEQPLKDLLAKINHPLLEVRSRSLRSLSLKLRSGLVAPESLIHEETLLTHLLQWFNFPEWRLEQQVLGLIGRLAEYEAAATTLISIGAIEFLSQLRLHCDPSLHPLIDGILEDLLRLPPSSVSPSGATTPGPSLATSEGSVSKGPPSSDKDTEARGMPSSLPPSSSSSLPPSVPRAAVPDQCEGLTPSNEADVQTFTTELTTDVGSYRHMSGQSLFSSLATSSFPSSSSPVSSSSHPSIPLLPSDCIHDEAVPGNANTHRNASSSSTITSAGPGQATPTGRGQTTPIVTRSSQPMSNIHVPQYSVPLQPSLSRAYVNTQSPGNFQGSSLVSDGRYMVHAGSVSATLEDQEKRGKRKGGGGGERRLLPWLRLSVNDRHILATTESHLQSDSSLQTSCRFLSDVLFQDIPPEVFLQRPAILRLLLAALERTECQATQLSLLRCLSELTAQLAQRLRVLTSPACGTADHYTMDVHSANLVSPEALTNQNTQSESHDLEQLTQDMLVHLHSSEMTLDHYCSSLFSSSTGLLSQHLSRQGVLGEREGEGSSLPHVGACLDLVRSLVEVVELARGGKERGGREGGGEERGEEGRRRGGGGGEDWGVEHLCTALSHCLVLWRHISAQPSTRYTHLQLVCLASLSMATCLARMASIDCCEGWTAPPYLSPLLRDLVMNGVILLSSPKLHSGLLHLLKHCDAESYQTFQRIKKLSASFSKMSEFLGKKTTPTAMPTTTPSKAGLATAALPGLWFHCNDEFVTTTLDFCLKILSSESERLHWDMAESLLLSLLAHDSEPAQAVAYQHLKEKILTSSTNVPSSEKAKAGESEMVATSPPLSLSLRRGFLEELCCRGCLSPCPQVSSSAAAILTHILRTEGEVSQPQLREMLTQWLPCIEVAMTTDEELCSLVQKLLLGSDDLPELVQLQSSLRMLHSTSTELRLYAFSLLSKRLLSDTPGKLSPFSSPPSMALHDVLVEGRPPRSQERPRQKSSLEHSDMVKLLHIVRSPVMDHLLKRSAVEQLAILLTDFSLHESALEEDIVSELLGIFGDSLKNKEKENKQERGEGGEEVESSDKETGEERSDPKDFLKPCIQCLQLLVQTCPELRKKLTSDCCFLLDTFRAALLCHKDSEALHLTSSLLSHLLFTTAARHSHKTHQMKLPAYLLARLKFTSSIGSYLPENPHKTPCPLNPSQLSSPLSQNLLLLLYHSAMAKSQENLLTTSDTSPTKSGTQDKEKRQLLAGDTLALRGVCVKTALQESLVGLKKAVSHKGVAQWLNRMAIVVKFCPHESWGGESVGSVVALGGDWRSILGRFLKVQPVTVSDKRLLVSLLHTLRQLLDSTVMEQLCGGMFLSWVAEVAAGSEGVCVVALQSLLEPRNSQREASIDSLLKRELLLLYAGLAKKLASSSPLSTSEGGGSGCCEVPLSLIQTLSRCLSLASSPHNRSLPVLQSCAKSLFYLTALMSNHNSMTKELFDVCTQLTTSLRQALCSFISGRGSMLTSFMGTGVISRAALSLCHLLRVVAQARPQEEWYFRCLTSDPSGGFNWLQYLTGDREPQVRYAGFNILASLCTSRRVAENLVACWTPEDNFGLWGASMRVALDTAEWSLVRQQALLVLVSLTALCKMHDLWDQLLIYRDEELTLKGMNAVETFLHHFPLNKLIQTDPPTTAPSHSPPPPPPPHPHHVSPHPTLPTDPHIMSTACQLLQNLTLSFPTLTHSQLHSQPSAEHLLRVVDPLTLRHLLSESSQQSGSAFILTSWLNMCSDVVNLLQVQVTTGSEVILAFLLAEGTMPRLCNILQVLWTTARGKGCGLQLCAAVLGLLVCVVEMAPYQREVVFTGLLSHWSSFTALLHYSLLHTNPSSSLLSIRTHSLSLLHSLLAHQLSPPSSPTHSALSSALTQLLDSDPNTNQLPKPASSEEGGAFNAQIEHEILKSVAAASGTEGDLERGLLSSPCGGALCSALLEVYEGGAVLARKRGCGQGAELVFETLCLLLASSKSAKETALRGGLVDSTLEQVRTLHAQLLGTEPIDSAHPTRKKEPAQVARIVRKVGILRNMMYQSTEVKSTVERCGLLSLIHTLWPWCTVSPRLAQAVLSMLTVFTAQNSAGRTALAGSTRGTDSLLLKMLQHASHTLSSHRSCTAAKMRSPLAEVMAACFSLLTNCALSSECRGVMKKSGFLTSFTTLNPRPTKSTSSTRRDRDEVSLWTRLFLSLSFSDGQQMIMKLPGVLDSLLDIHQSSEPANQSLCLLIFRNLCFYGPSKTLLVENENFLAVLVRNLENGDLRNRTMVASGVWALAHNCAKIKKTLRCAGLHEKLQVSLSCCTHGGQGEALQTQPSGDTNTHTLFQTIATNALASIR